MDEFKFVLKCLGIAAAFMVLTQIKTGEVSIEEKIEASLVNSTVSTFVNKVADGGVKLIKDGANSAKEIYLDWKNSEKTTKHEAVEKPVEKPKVAQPTKMEFKEAQSKIEKLSVEDDKLTEDEF
ncbi:MAG: hypothetical protein ABL930_10710 [Pseudobdellovibrio sp.]